MRQIPESREESAEGNEDQNAIDVITHKIAAAKVDLASDYKTIQGIMVRGRILLAPYHFFVDYQGDELEDGDPITVTAVGAIFRDVFDRSRFQRIDGDVAIFELLPNSRTFADIVHHFATDRDLQSKPVVNAMLLTRRNEMYNSPKLS